MASKKVVIDLDPQGPSTFTRAIRIPTGDGKQLTVDFDFLFRDRIGMAELFQKWDAMIECSRSQARLDAAAATTAEDGQTTSDRPDLVAAALEGIAADVDTLMDFITGWNVSHEFCRDNLAAFARKYPGAPLALVRDYREGMTQGRLGN